MRTVAGCAALALVTLTAGCGGGSSTSSGSAASSAPAGAPVAVGATLTGTLGKPDQPNAFVIGLTGDAGQAVPTLKPGKYTIKVDDRSNIHNWHLAGPRVDQKTGVQETGAQTFDVALQAGTYTYICDPHPGMKGSFTVA